MIHRIYIAWDDNPELFNLTFLHLSLFYKHSRLATLKEVIDHAAECESFINLIKFSHSINFNNSDELVEVKEGTFKILWETNKDPVGFEEKYIYLVDFEGNKHLVY
jgi:hypothetical protein